MTSSSPAVFSATHPIAVSRRANAATVEHVSQFGRILERQRGPAVSESTLQALAATMRERRGSPDPPDADATNAMPAGYTYLGQFIDHDLTFDERLFSQTTRPRGPIRNFRTPRFDLDSLYGDGPRGADAGLYASDRKSLAVGAHDLVRHRSSGIAVIKDRRNDSNRILSQFHLAMATFHNRVVTRNPTATFGQVREVVTRHYQWIALHDFLVRLVGDEIVQSILKDGPARARGKLKLFPVAARPKIPFEFSAAAFRFGHSMVREDYGLNTKSGKILTFDGGSPDGGNAHDLRGFRPMPAELAIDWEFFFAIPGGNPNVLQLARPIDTLIARPLFDMPTAVADDATVLGRRLPYRNLHRGEVDLQLASGQQLALIMGSRGVPGADRMKILGRGGVPMTVVPGQYTVVGENDSNLGDTGIGLDTVQAHFGGRTPLWYYVLKEAAQLEGGRRLGPVGGRIVAEVFISLLLSDKTSILRADSRWRPKRGEYGCRQNGDYSIADLLFYASGAGPT